MDYKVSYIQQWHPSEGTHYTQQLRISATWKEIEDYGLNLDEGINYTHLDEFYFCTLALGINGDKRVLFNRNSVIKFEPKD